MVERLLKENAPEVRGLARFLRRRNPALVLAAARGRGGLAALYAKHLLEARLLWPVLPLALPLFALYGARPKAPFPSLLLAYDLAGEGAGAAELVRAYRGEGVLTLAFVGREESPLAGAAEAVLPLHLGGAEGAGFLAGLAATAQLAAHLLEETRLREALPALPEAMARSLEGGRAWRWGRVSSFWGRALPIPWPWRPPCASRRRASAPRGWPPSRSFSPLTSPSWSWRGGTGPWPASCPPWRA
ncbi:sugar aminotransferase [Thermus thermophilus]|nr:sugar aminotransferase [Thermus thermophilus]